MKPQSHICQLTPLSCWIETITTNKRNEADETNNQIEPMKIKTTIFIALSSSSSRGGYSSNEICDECLGDLYKRYDLETSRDFFSSSFKWKFIVNKMRLSAELTCQPCVFDEGHRLHAHVKSTNKQIKMNSFCQDVLIWFRLIVDAFGGIRSHFKSHPYKWSLDNQMSKRNVFTMKMNKKMHQIETIPLKI